MGRARAGRSGHVPVPGAASELSRTIHRSRAGARRERLAEDIRGAVELLADAGVDLAVGGADDAAAARDPALGAELEPRRERDRRRLEPGLDELEVVRVH